MYELDDAWESFCNGDYTKSVEKESINRNNIHTCSDIYISTKTMISFLNVEIPLYTTFWRVPILPYYLPKIGVVKKQMKFISYSEEELQSTLSNIESSTFHEEYVISKTSKDGRSKYKDIRKISIGLCKKDITSYRCKKKSAFYNCFALILRIYHKGLFKEIHVKVFNTGKLEIPGIQSDEVLEKTLLLLCETLTPILETNIPLVCDRLKNETVLINSNFTCGYFIDREKLYQRLKYHYHINSVYDPCSYPGIQGEFYYNTESTYQDGKQPLGSLCESKKEKFVKISFMIFRTGSALIVGKCNECMLRVIYVFLKNLLETEYDNVCAKTNETQEHKYIHDKKRKKIIVINCVK
jgi:hypothetical protein